MAIAIRAAIRQSAVHHDHISNKNEKHVRVTLVSLFCFLSLYTIKVFAQPPFDSQRLIADSSIHLTTPKIAGAELVPKRFGRASLFLGIAEITPWIYDRYVVNKDYARISFKTVGYNLKLSSWTWDNDEFQTNQFGHPYHGSIFFNSFRQNGYTFWQSAPAAIVGSFLWETWAENQAPAPNDLINTSFGGIVLGEMTYRISKKIINNSSRGFKRQVSEVIGLVMNPMAGLNRITSGKWGKVSHDIQDHDTTKVNAEFDAGIRKFNATNSNLIKSKIGFYGRIKFLYGTPNVNYKVPFSNIYINAELGQDDSSKLNVINVYGSLAGWHLSSSQKRLHLAILSVNYDYINNNAFFYGGQSIKMNVFSEYRVNSSIKINTVIGAGPVLLAAVPDNYLYHGRNYDFTSGASVAGGGGFNIRDKYFLGIDYRGSWLTTINGNEAHYFLHVITNEVRCAIVSHLSICLGSGYFNLHGTYKYHYPVNKNYPFVRLSTRYTIKL